MAAPLGNTNATKSKPWAAALNRALERRSLAEKKAGLDELADALIDQCLAGNLGALQELGNRMDGKPAQSLTVSGDPDNPLDLSHKVEFVGAHPTAPKA